MFIIRACVLPTWTLRCGRHQVKVSFPDKCLWLEQRQDSRNRPASREAGMIHVNKPNGMVLCSHCQAQVLGKYYTLEELSEMRQPELWMRLRPSSRRPIDRPKIDLRYLEKFHSSRPSQKEYHSMNHYTALYSNYTVIIHLELRYQATTLSDRFPRS